MDHDKLARELFDTLGTPWDDCAREGEGDRDIAKIAQALERAELEGKIEGIEACSSEIAHEKEEDAQRWFAVELAALRKRLEELNA